MSAKNNIRLYTKLSVIFNWEEILNANRYFIFRRNSLKTKLNKTNNLKLVISSSLFSPLIFHNKVTVDRINHSAIKIIFIFETLRSYYANLWKTEKKYTRSQFYIKSNGLLSLCKSHGGTRHKKGKKNNFTKRSKIKKSIFLK